MPVVSAPIQPGWPELLPLLVHIQSQLDADLSLAALARRLGVSPFRLHRLFKATLGETPQAYTTRLRLERAAFELLTQDSTLLSIALDSGYQNHETFTRAFKRHFGRTPSSYRQWMLGQRAQSHAPARGGESNRDTEFAISPTKVVRLRAMHLAFVRHVGPYDAVPASLFEDLHDWAERHRLVGPRLWLGIGHDAPVTTPVDKLRFDAALVVPDPFTPEGHIGCQQLPAGDYAVTTHVGPFATLPAAYAELFPRVMALPGYRLIGLPAVEIYQAALVDTRHRLNQTQICLPVARRGAR